jgi:biopolymer transport protein ExbB
MTPTRHATLARAAAAAALLTWTALAHAQPDAGADSAFGLESLWSQSDLVARSVLLILAVMSAGSWYIIAVKLIEQARIRRQAHDAARKFWDAASVRQGTEALSKDSPYRVIAEAGIDASGGHHRLVQHVSLSEWLSQGIQRATEPLQVSLQNGLAFLATVGSTAPFVGLFGTVWGIFHALRSIGVAGQASIDKVAGPVGEALIMTAIGLAVAVPAVLGYNWLIRRNKAALDAVRTFGQDVHSALLVQSGSPT